MPVLMMQAANVREVEEMLQMLVMYRSDESFNVGVLPRRAWGDELFAHVEGVDSAIDE